MKWSPESVIAKGIEIKASRHTSDHTAIVLVLVVDKDRNSTTVPAIEDCIDELRELLLAGARPVAFWILPMARAEFLPVEDRGEFSIDDWAIIDAMYDHDGDGPGYRISIHKA